MTEALKVCSENPFQELTLKTRVRQLLHTHQGRDKLFKVLQYTLRLKLWFHGVDVNPAYMVDHPGSVTDTEKNLMTTMNTRRLFRVGRFMGEFVRLHVTLIKCSDLLCAPRRGTGMSLFLQLQMVADITARLLMLMKSVCEDVAYLAQKGFLHTNVADRLLHISAKCALPVLSVDLALNTLRLAQGVVDAADSSGSRFSDEKSAPGKTLPRADRSFSLLSEYDSVDKLRRPSAPLRRPSAPSTPPPASSQDLTLLGGSRDEFESDESRTPVPSSRDPQDGAVANTSFLYDMAQSGSTIAEDRKRCDEDSLVVVHSYPMLFWADFELHWIFVTEMKLILDIFVALSVLGQWKTWKGGVSFAGFISGLLSVYRVWTYGR